MDSRKIKILYASPEVVPFGSTGGLGEVAGSLPEALNVLTAEESASGNTYDCRVIAPLYKITKDKYLDRLTFLGETSVTLGWRNQYVGVFSYVDKHTTYYFIDNEYYFYRDGLYGFFDDGERYAFFSKSIFVALPLMDFAPDIINANDWQTALVPVYQTSVYRRQFMKTVFTIHNVRYQGQFGQGIYDSVVDIPWESRHLLAYGNDVNFMKGGIECANAFSTVSPTYAEELKNPAFAFGMEGIVRRNAHKLCGILNGINMTLYDPETDPAIAGHFSAGNIRGKGVCKRALQREVGLPESKAPLIIVITRLAYGKGMDIVTPVIDQLLYKNDMQFVVLGTGEYEYEEFFRGLEARHPDKVRALIRFDSALSHRMYAAADMILVPSYTEPCGLTQMIGCRYGTVPVVRETGGLKDSIQDCTLGEGNGFVFRDYTPESLKQAVERALALYRDRRNWNKLVKYDLGVDFSWARSAHEYARLYDSLMD